MLSLLKPHARVLGAVLFCFVLLAFLELAMPQVIGYVVDHVFKGDSPPGQRMVLLAKVLVVVLAIYVSRNGLYYLSRPRMTAIGENVAFQVRQKLVRHLHTLSVDFYQRSNPGKISSRVMRDVQGLKLFIQEELSKLTINLLMLVVGAGMMFRLNWLLALVTLAVMPLHVLVYYFFRKPIAVYAREVSERMADVSGNLVTQFDASSVATVKAAATQLLEQEKINDSMQKSMKAQIKHSKYYALQKIAADMLIGVGGIIVLSVGGFLVLYRDLTAGQFIAFYGLVGLVYPRLLNVVTQAGKFTKVATCLDRVDEIMAIKPGVQEKPDAIPAEISRGKIEFRNVTFGYHDERLLSSVSFTIEPNEHVLVTGPSGAGKSSCVNLIPRFHEPQEGRILIDGIDIEDFTLASLRRQIGFVFQDCFLFNDTVIANIRYAWPQASTEQVMEAARRAYAEEFILHLPDGYMTQVGSGGIQLSAGQKRRLMVARAILKNPKILIMDEPLVSLDPEARKQVTEGLHELIHDRTVLTITHYPEELPYADKQMQISHGKVTMQDIPGRAVRLG